MYPVLLHNLERVEFRGFLPNLVRVTRNSVLLLIIPSPGIKFNISHNTDVIEASALSYKYDHIQVYSNSWGPRDDGFTVDGPGPLVLQALKDSVTKVCL